MIFPYICESIGMLRYSEGTQGPRCVLEVDPEIANYARSMIPKYHHVKQPMYAPHITVIRHEKPSKETWAAHDNSQIMFWYNHLYLMTRYIGGLMCVVLDFQKFAPVLDCRQQGSRLKILQVDFT